MTPARAEAEGDWWLRCPWPWPVTSVHRCNRLLLGRQGEQWRRGDSAPALRRSWRLLSTAAEER